MKSIIELMIVGNLALFILTAMFAGASAAQGLHGAFWFFAVASLVHALAADSAKKYKDKKFPEQQ